LGQKSLGSKARPSSQKYFWSKFRPPGQDTLRSKAGTSGQKSFLSKDKGNRRSICPEGGEPFCTLFCFNVKQELESKYSKEKK
jgi:hypothetical protein